MPNPNKCKPCNAFFSLYSCSAASHGECDCPKCQGYCKCTPPAAPKQFDQTAFTNLIAAMSAFDPAAGNVLDAFFNSKCIHAGCIGSDQSDNCSDRIAARGRPGEHVCENHFDKFLNS